MIAPILQKTKKLLINMAYREVEEVEVRCCIIEKREASLHITQEQSVRIRGRIHKVNNEVWIPRSQVSYHIVYGINKNNPDLKDARITIPQWLADEKRLEY